MVYNEMNGLFTVLDPDKEDEFERLTKKCLSIGHTLIGIVISEYIDDLIKYGNIYFPRHYYYRTALLYWADQIESEFSEIQIDRLFKDADPEFRRKMENNFDMKVILH